MIQERDHPDAGALMFFDNLDGLVPLLLRRDESVIMRARQKITRLVIAADSIDEAREGLDHAAAQALAVEDVSRSGERRLGWSHQSHVVLPNTSLVTSFAPYLSSKRLHASRLFPVVATSSKTI